MISVIITERERFGFTKESVLSVLRHLEGAAEVLYVGGATPPGLIAFLKETQKKNKKFKLVLKNRPTVGNEAFRVGLSAARRPNDIVFMQNDVVVQRGWLGHMMRCARETGAGVVVPVVLEGKPEGGRRRIHDAGASFVGEGGAERRLVHFLHQRNYDLKKLHRREVDVIEFHCLFVKRLVLETVPLDEEMGDLAGQLDFSLECNQRNVKIMVEPKARVIFAHPSFAPVVTHEDLRFFLDRWNERNCRLEISHMVQKWGISPRTRYLLEKRGWAILYKVEACEPLGILYPPELSLWRATRTKWCPEWFRAIVERYMVTRVLAGVTPRLVG